MAFVARLKPEMTAIPVSAPKQRATDLIDYAIEAHGPRRVLLRALVALLVRDKADLNLGELGPHLRRDIGLSVEPGHTVLRGPHLL